MNTKYGEINVELSQYLHRLVDRIFKLLPLREEDNVGLEKYIKSLIVELCGVKEIFSIEDEPFISLIATLEEINTLDFEQYRREVFRCINIVQRLSEVHGYEQSIS